jgi:hypothetical protein
VFHVQTEVIKGKEPKIETTVFLEGRVVGSRLLPAAGPDTTPEQLQSMRDEQHATIVQNLVNRLANLQARRAGEQQGAVPAAPVSEGEVPAMPSPGSSPSLLASIRARSLIGRFRGAVEVVPPRSHDELIERLAGIAELIDSIVGSPTFSDIRVDEQVRFNLLKERIADWQGSDEKDHDTGVRIWSDVVVLFAYLGKINSRDELRRFDHQLLSSVLPQVESDGMTPKTIANLRSLFGLDVELDRMLDAPDGAGPERWLATLRQLRDDIASTL